MLTGGPRPAEAVSLLYQPLGGPIIEIAWGGKFGQAETERPPSARSLVDGLEPLRSLMEAVCWIAWARVLTLGDTFLTFDDIVQWDV